ncbi:MULTISPECIES: MFS transporter [unclassified Sphingopyxis]|uniref:MFS transporter n=1 Tax=unclassified Sphingopyxis TaxID=2614943 RepID=UPI0007372FB4|nr:MULTISPECIES: MFS transporter [unclassified Sphingopyxis]KTE25686.1 MFS transporter [Sphingopyxis sp. HIX]KTE73322.1 MFS transporter [Sphingopyxis sp. HXXIV]
MRSPKLAAMKQPWIVILCAALIVTLAMGVRQSFGLFLPQMSVDIGISRSDFGLAMALQNLLFGLVQPFVGALADKHGAGRVVLAGALLYALGLIGAAFASDAIGLHISFGLLIGMAQSATTFVVVLGAVGRVVPPEKRSGAFGIVTAGGSLGQFLVVPLASMLLRDIGYHETLWIMAGLVALCGLLAIGVAGRTDASPGLVLEVEQSAREALREAAVHRGYWLLNAGFFVCGFHIAFIATHLPAYLDDKGLGIEIGAQVLALVGLFNILGSYVFGRAGDVLRQKYILSGLYVARSAVIALFLFLPLTHWTALVFAGAMGFLWLGTVPLTSGIVGRIFGIRYLSMLYGIVFLSHQVGSFFGAWMAGLIFDATGSYDIAWGFAIALGLFAGLVHLPIADAPLKRTAPA